MGEALDLAVHLTPQRQSIYDLEKGILEMPQVECPVTHYFSPGIYAREVFIPAGVVLTGKIHRAEHLAMVMSGDISVLSDAGMVRLQGPHVFTSSAGIKRVGLAHTDTRFLTIHATDCTDIDKLEDELALPLEEQAQLIALARESLT